MRKMFLSFAVMLALAGAVYATGETAPLDLASTGTELAGYIAGAAASALAIFAGLYGIRVIIRAFRSVK